MNVSFPPLRFLPAVLALVMVACAAGPFYSPTADRETRRLRSKSLKFMERAEEPFAEHADAAGKLLAELQEVRDRAATRYANRESVAQWDLLLAPEGHLLGGFVARWEAESTLAPTFIVESARLVGDAFDAIIRLEQSKTGSGT